MTQETTIPAPAKTQRISGAEALIRCLIEEGVSTLFGYPGGAIMPVYDALYHYADQVNHILVRHEQGAIHAAEGYARASKKTGVCLVTSGPGATNIITGLADAMADSTPLVCITGQVASPLLGTDAFQETDVIGISTPVTKWNYLITKASEIPEIMSKAFYIASTGRPGPVLIDFAKDAQFDSLDFTYIKEEAANSFYLNKPTLAADKIKTAAQLINEAKAPYLLIGQGILLSGAEKALQSFLEKTHIPTASTLLGLSALPAKHQQNKGLLGMHGNYAPNLLTNECDVLIAIGMRFDDRVTGNLKRYAKQAKIIHIDIDAAELNKVVPATLAIQADAKEAILALHPLVHHQERTEWLKRFADLQQKEEIEVISPIYTSASSEIKMAQVIRELSEQSQGEAIITTDVGQHQMVTCRYYHFNQPLSNITSGGLGTMGFALPAAIGACLAAPQREVVAVIGDGGFQMTFQELGTILQYQIPVKILILNNNFLGMVRQWQELFFEKRYSFTEMVNPDFLMIAQAYGIAHEKITSTAELPGAITKMLQHKGPYLLEAVVEKEDNVFPMIPTGAGVDEVLLSAKKH